MALKIKPQYSKALKRAASCSLQIKDYDQCIDFCDEFLHNSPTDKVILDIKCDAVIEKVSVNIDECKIKIGISSSTFNKFILKIFTQCSLL